MSGPLPQAMTACRRTLPPTLLSVGENSVVNDELVLDPVPRASGVARRWVR